MEDIAVGIFRAIIIAILIISVVSRNKRQRAARHGGSDNSPAEMPWDMPHRDRASTPVPPAANQTPAPSAAQPRMPQPRPQQAKRIVTEPVVAKSRTLPVAAEPDEAEAMAAEYYRTRGAYRPAVSAESVAAQRPSEPASVAETAEKDDITARFNLRDAVLYSEILRPKFDE